MTKYYITKKVNQNTNRAHRGYNKCLRKLSVILIYTEDPNKNIRDSQKVKESQKSLRNYKHKSLGPWPGNANIKFLCRPLERPIARFTVVLTAKGGTTSYYAYRAITFLHRPREGVAHTPQTHTHIWILCLFIFPCTHTLEVFVPFCHTPTVTLSVLVQLPSSTPQQLLK